MYDNMSSIMRAIRPFFIYIAAFVISHNIVSQLCISRASSLPPIRSDGFISLGAECVWVCVNEQNWYNMYQASYLSPSLFLSLSLFPYFSLL